MEVTEQPARLRAQQALEAGREGSLSPALEAPRCLKKNKKVCSLRPVDAVCIFNGRSSQPRCLVLENHLLVPAYADGNSERQEVWPRAEAASGGAHYTERCTNAATAADLVQGGQ